MAEAAGRLHAIGSLCDGDRFVSKIVIFDLRGSVAHFRRPDTLGTHATYPFITRTALRGLLAAVLGRTSLPVELRAGVRLLNPVRTVAQELSLHGKTWEARSGQAESFHRPTAIELVVEPHYRIYADGPCVEELGERVHGRRSNYHTYLGSAFCLTFPEWKAETEAQPIVLGGADSLECVSVVPADAVGRLLPEEGTQYARVGGVLWDHEGEMSERRFRGRAVAVLYEGNGRPLRFEPASRAADAYWSFRRLPEEGTVCLW
jgi:CRISPR-associated protein Cas5h